MGAVRDSLTIKYVRIGELRPDLFNPRRISEEEMESLTRSIREFGLVDPLVVRREDKTIKKCVSRNENKVRGYHIRNNCNS